jgi:WD40 repeat protein
MKHKVGFAFLSIVLSLSLLATGCTKQSAENSILAGTPSAFASPTRPEVVFTPTIPNTQTPVEKPVTATSTSAPTFTPVPPATPTNTPTPTPKPAPINSDNASQVKLLYTLPTLGGFDSLIFSATGVYTATVAEDGSILTKKIDGQVFHEPNNAPYWVLNNEDQTNGFIFPNGHAYGSYLRDKKGYAVKIWLLSDNLADKKLVDVSSGYLSSGHFAISPDEKHFVSLSPSEFISFDYYYKNGKLVNTSTPHWWDKPWDIKAKYTSPSGYLYKAPKVDQAVPIQFLNFDMFKGEGFSQLQFSPDNQYMAAISYKWELAPQPLPSAGDQVRIWNVADGKLYRRMAGNGTLDIAFSPDSRTLAMLNGELNIVLWQFDTQKNVQTIKGDFSSIQFSPDGSLLASGSKDGSIQLWQASDGKLLATLKGHTAPVTTVAFSPDGLLFASVSQDGIGKLWEIEGGN